MNEADLLQSETDVNVVDDEGCLPLHLAARNNNKETVVDLLAGGADVNAVDDYGYTALHLAALQNSEYVVTELIRRGADVNAVNEYGDTPLHLAAFKDCKETALKLLQHGADVNAVDVNGRTTLHSAARNRNRNARKGKEIAAQLYQRGVDVNAVDKSGNTPLHLAALGNSKDVAVDLVQRGANVNGVNNYGTTPLHYAALENSKETAIGLLQRGADVNAVDESGRTALHLTALYRSNSKEIVAALLEHGADFNAVFNDGSTPLHLAARYNNKEIAADMLQRGADVNAMNKSGNTPLHRAASGNSKDVVVVLRQHGANITINSTGNTPLDIATRYEDTFEEICQQFQTTLFLMNKRGQSALHLAAINCFTRVLRLPNLNEEQKGDGKSKRLGFCNYPSELLVNLPDIKGNTPLHYWSMVSLESLPNKVVNNPADIIKCGETLAAIGASVDARNRKDLTPLHVASSWEAVDVLIEDGAYPNVTDMHNGDTPLITRMKSLGNVSDLVYENFSFQKEKTSKSHVSLIHEWKRVIEKGLDPWIANSKSETVLELLIQKSKFLLAEALILAIRDMTKLDKKLTNGESILHVTCASGADELQNVIDGLLKCHANVNAINNNNETPLHVVCRKLAAMGEEKMDVGNTMYFWTASRLLSYGANPRLQDMQSATCFDIAAKVPELLNILTQPIHTNVISPLLKWSDPKSGNHRSKIAQVVRNQNFHQVEYYHYHKEPIGSGAFGHVFVGVDDRNGREIAVKRVEKQRLLRREDRREIANLVTLRNCEEIVKYLGHCEDNYFVYLILDLMEGTLEDYMNKTPRDVSLDVTLCQDLINALLFLHRNNVLHRDIKPRNILYKVSPRVCLKLADFGLSTKVVFDSSPSVMYTGAGTRCWMAPELLNATKQIKHSKASDVFACGLVLHFLLADKRHPFEMPSKTVKSAMDVQNETERNIMDYKPFFYYGLSPDARDLVEKLLLENDSERPDIFDVTSHPFFWSKTRMAQFMDAVGNQPEVQKPRHIVATSSAIEQQLENSLGKYFLVNPWDNPIMQVYMEMTCSRGGRRYDTSSAVELVRFVRNAYAHVSDDTRTAHVQDLLLKDFIFFDKFPSLLIEVYNAVKAHGWDKRPEIETVLKENSR